MKRFYCLTFFALAPFFAFSQNWALFGSAALNFENPQTGQPLAKTIFVQPADPANPDSSYYATPRKLKFQFGLPYVVEAGNLLGDSIVQKTGGVYEFHFLPYSPPALGLLVDDPFVIRSRAQVGETWTFSDTITAEVSAVEDQTVFDQPDSVKSIALSDGRTIRISKNFGLLQLGDFHLIGLEGTGIGVQVPNNLDWYDWQPDDVYQYHLTFESTGNTAKIWRKILIQNKTVSPTEIAFTVRSLTRREDYQWGNLVSTAFKDEIVPLVIPSPDEIQLPGGFSGATSCGYANCVYALSDSGWVRSIASINTPSCTVEVLDEDFIAGLGRTHYYHKFAVPGSSGITTEDLIGYQKAGQNQHGTVYGNDFFGVTGAVDPANGREPEVFPNPAGDFVIIRGDENEAVRLLELRNAAGQNVLQANKYRWNEPLALNGLPAGLYYLTIRTDRHVWLKKIAR